jgi:uncharacterized OB-fold protein
MDVSLPPQPHPDLDSDGFWAATSKGRLDVCRCRACEHWHQPPLERCRECGGETHFVPVSGAGTLRSFIVVRHPAVPGFLEDLPYVVGLVDLDEQAGLRLPGRLLDVTPEALRGGERVTAEIVPLPGGDFRVAAFRVVSD